MRWCSRPMGGGGVAGEAVLMLGLLERIARGEEAIARRRVAGEPVPPDWEPHLARLKALAAQVGTGACPAAPPFPGPRYTPGCLYDYAPGRRVRPLLRCVAHPGCPREVVLWREGLLAEMFTLEKLAGTARLEGEREWQARHQ